MNLATTGIPRVTSVNGTVFISFTELDVETRVLAPSATVQLSAHEATALIHLLGRELENICIDQSRPSAVIVDFKSED